MTRRAYESSIVLSIAESLPYEWPEDVVSDDVDFRKPICGELQCHPSIPPHGYVKNAGGNLLIADILS